MALAPPPGLNLNDEAQTKIVGSLFTTWTLAVIAVLLRFVSRKIAKAGLWVDDWLMLSALIICTLLTFIAGVWRMCMYSSRTVCEADKMMAFRDPARSRKAYLRRTKPISLRGCQPSVSVHCGTVLYRGDYERQVLDIGVVLATVQAENQNPHLHNWCCGLLLGNRSGTRQLYSKE